MDWYHKVARRLVKGSKVEQVLKEIAEDAQSLVNYHAVKSASPQLHSKFAEIAEEMASLPSSLPAEEGGTQTFTSFEGTQNVGTDSSTQHNNFNQSSGQ